MPTKIGRYDILGILGRGGMGVVYKAFDRTMDRIVALKTMDSESLRNPSLRERFYREARAAGKLQHPNIVTIYELGEENNMPYIVMEYLQGIDLRQILKKQEPIPLEKKIGTIVQLCRGLGHAHRAGIVHRDVKPPNILVMPDGEVKILDFGIARLLSAKASSSSGKVFGSVHYMSPEQIRGGNVDGKSDIFSAGIILYEFLTYKRPFYAKEVVKVLYKILNEGPEKMNPPLDEEYPAIKRVVERALQRDPANRYSSAEEMVDELEEFLRSFVPSPEVKQAASESPGEPPKFSAEDKTPTVPETNPQVLELVRTGKRLFAEGSLVQSLTCLQKALKISPGNAEAHQLVQMVQQDIKRAEAEELLKRAQGYVEEGHYDVAVKAFEKILKIDPVHSKARVLIESVRNEFILPQVEQLLANAKNAYSENHYQLAIEHAEEALRVYPSHLETQELLALVKERLVSIQFNELLENGEQFLREKQFDAAAKTLERALAIFPHHPVAMKRLEDAQKKYQILQLVQRGNQQLELGNYDEAQESFEEALRMDPENQEARAAIDDISGKLRRDLIQQLLNQGWQTLMMKKQYDEAIRIGEKILALDPDNTEAIRLVGAARKERA